ncbi:hypothetical protein JXB37_02520 [candidate division WOR-3 bacterium]|nr:hypothetical protein [candidate division WOR-3 bacterium]
MKRTSVALMLAGMVALAAPADQVVSLLRGLRPSAPAVHGNLAVFLLTGPATGSRDYVTLDRAISKGWVEVEEKEGGEVNTVRVRNKSSQRVFGLAGEMITGAKQTRMLQQDVLLPAKSAWLDLPVYCVEHGRWHGESDRFGSKGQIVAGRVRGNAANNQSQGEVWAEVSRSNADLGIVTGTDRFDAVFEDEKVQGRLEEYRRGLGESVPALKPDAIGVAVAVGDRLVCVDIFCSPAMFRKMWPRLLESYVVDALASTPTGKLSAGEVSDFLAEAAAAPIVSQPTVGSGQLLRIDGADLAGSALVSGSEVVHLDLFPGEQTDPGPLRLDIRRNGSRR